MKFKRIPQVLRKFRKPAVSGISLPDDAISLLDLIFSGHQDYDMVQCLSFFE